ncbi:MAG: DUF3006 domain-containing protein [Armatimonadota bacterium]|nr:DUF3006 domain-containing protein [Armatimonadota bacterium]
MSKSDVKAFVDRIEGDIAVLLVGDEHYEVNLPKHFLPPETVEGCVLIWHFQLDEEAASGAKESISRLIEQLGEQFAE